MLREVQMVATLLMKFQREGKTIPGLVCKESVVCGQLELKNQLRLAVEIKRLEQ